ncbi:hypothetical protein [Phenylobacterium sp. J367]|uniref:hypothetical protein n=1 Tax=Phenylobacterium sp. J367 TaxID=2898435 RepID=UPI002151751F|nr:hypothetical protein [Phenylobacterium sp. J367]MCR5879602.1 hypothetical protein [Phenylobacterium sp. J367]
MALASAVGTVATGWLAERLSARHPNAIAWLPGAGMILSVPFYVWAFTTSSLWAALVGLCVGGAMKYGYLAGQYTISQGVVSAQFRAVATAILLFLANLLGYGLGPLFIGAASDLLFSLQVADLGAAGLSRQACEGAARAALAVGQAELCATASAKSLQRAMLITSGLYAFGGLFFLISCRWLQRDIVRPAAADR